MSDESNTDTYTVSFKTSGGYDASLIVVRGDNVQELADNISAIHEDIVSLVVDTENLVHVAYAAKSPTATAAPASAAPAAAPATPAEEVRMCAHGKRDRREGTKNGRKWVGYFCALPKGTDGSCKAEFE